ncbi:MAG: TMEM165/GDT1 family protein [Candidatus Nanopelagicales bacterium]|nr:TMEM165/GDT1 family protein [Candidatus Nanopelagicales bacterium]MDD2819096.1 TMEM165/GDT1 family protein [Candidatus Nanopelagicales bacterium]
MNQTFDLGIALTTFFVIFLAELPDKSFIASLVLATRFRHLYVWLGVSAAFFIQCLIAVTAGGFIALLPQEPVLAVTAIFFLAGSIVLIRGGLKSRAQEAQEEAAEESEVLAKVGASSTESVRRTIITSFVVIFAAEWGDLTQIFAAAQAAKTGQPFTVFVGAWIGLIAVAGIAVVLGRWLQQRIPLSRVRIASGLVLLALAVWTATEFFQALSTP